MKVQPYLNFDGNAETAFNFYKSVFGGEFITFMKMNEGPGLENVPEDEKNRIMHVSLPLGGDVILMGSDILPSMGHKLTIGNNNYISLHVDSRKQADEIFEKLSTEGAIEMPMADQFWGDYFGSFTDRFGVKWMINHNDGTNG